MSGNEQKIKLQFERLNQKKQVLMNLIRDLSPESYLLHPDPKTWSAGQVANHLYQSERLSLAYIRKKLSFPDKLLPFSIKSWWSLYAVNFILWTPIKVKAPAPINMWKDIEILPPDQLDTKWNVVRKELAEVIAEHQPGFKSHLVFNHPISGRMTMTQMLIFFNHHMAHHIRQIRRILKKTGRNT